ncbi:MAG TPA: 3',5'-cyclic-nucleotide phosphodiesterase [Gammaproteobacteria bacterium]
MELRVLGCSGGIGAGLRTTCLLLDGEILIDVGTGIGDLSQAELRRVRHIFLTHSHLDHIAGLPLLVDTLFGVHASPLTVHALPQTIDTLKTHIFNWKIWPDFAALPDPDRPSMQYVPMQYGESLTLDGRVIHMLPAVHTVPAAGYLVSTKTGSFAFSGDTSSNREMWEIVNDVEDLKLLIVECAFANKEQHLSELAKHYCPRYLAEDMAQLHPDVRVAITHLKPGNETMIMEECRSAIPDRELIQLRGGEVFTI